MARILLPFCLCVFLSLLITLFAPAGVQGHASDGDNRLTPEELDLLPKFRVIVQDMVYKDWMKTDEYLVRWLRVRGHNLKAARDALQEAMEWRKSNNIDHILEEDFSDLDGEFKVIFGGTDKDGRPLAIFNIGSVDIRKMVISGREKRIARLVAQCLELVETVLRDMKNVTQAFFVVDLAGFNLRQHACARCVPTALSLFQYYELYYPDIAYRAYALNTPRAFIPIYEIVRPLLNGPNQRAVRLYDNNAEKWKKGLLGEIDADQLPKQYGGTKIVHSTTMSSLKKANPLIKAVFDRAAASASAAKKQVKTE